MRHWLPSSSQHLHVTSHCTAGICCLLCRHTRRTLSDVNCQGLVLVWKRSTGSLFILPPPCPVHVWWLFDADVVLWWGRRVLKVTRHLSKPLNVARCLWLASVATEDEKRWESRGKENLLAATPWRAFTKCQWSQPSCFLSVCLRALPPLCSRGTAFNFNLGGCH